MVENLRELVNARELLFTWTRREFKVRYSQSVLGVAWALLQPLSIMLITTLVFSIFLRVPSSDIPYPIFVYSGLLAWLYFANTLSTATTSVADNYMLVSKVYFPREILPLSLIFVGFVDFLIAGSIFVVLLFIYHVQIGLAVLLLPLVILIQTVLIFSISLLLGAVNVFYRDIRFVIPLLLQLWMYLSPIFYPIDIVPERIRPLYFLNPIATLIDTYRRLIFFNQAPDWPYLGVTALISIVLLIVSYRYFKRRERQFADMI
ncbi:MAG: ABC transporter permease [Anaerolineae bacterium]|nr:ABC transporter permease [Anaerolineae bacterium]